MEPSNFVICHDVTYICTTFGNIYFHTQIAKRGDSEPPVQINGNLDLDFVFSNSSPDLP